MVNHKPVVIPKKIHAKLGKLKFTFDLLIKDLASELLNEALKNPEIVEKVLRNLIKNPRDFPTRTFIEKFVKS